MGEELINGLFSGIVRNLAKKKSDQRDLVLTGSRQHLCEMNRSQSFFLFALMFPCSRSVLAKLANDLWL